MNQIRTVSALKNYLDKCGLPDDAPVFGMVVSADRQNIADDWTVMKSQYQGRDSLCLATLVVGGYTEEMEAKADKAYCRLPLSPDGVSAFRMMKRRSLSFLYFKLYALFPWVSELKVNRLKEPLLVIEAPAGTTSEAFKEVCEAFHKEAINSQKVF